MDQHDYKNYIKGLCYFAEEAVIDHIDMFNKAPYSAIGINCYLIILDSTDGSHRENDAADFDDWNYAVDFSYHTKGAIFPPNADPVAVKFENDYREFTRLKDKYYEGSVTISQIKESEYYKTAAQILNYLKEQNVMEGLTTANFEWYIVFDEAKTSPNIYIPV